ncbi:hypothetical protein CVT24_006726 [Panaeolus cyanescens]|uniref:Uncharacterized protein n=1 Tax=Panaeolus cyanescens TaxID=181874 RepID=A0A409V9G4_9AGAR|nr:hypothetical protein CVT24_006726 [Panaeolus cyanescens]
MASPVVVAQVNPLVGDFWKQIETRFSPYITHNDLPPEDIATDIKGALVEPQQQLDEVKRTIEVLNLTLQALERQRDDLQDRISSYTPIFSPIRRLPDDMLEEIFFHCLPQHRNPIPMISDCPLMLTFVCRKWRDVALSAPRLWSKLHISFEHEPRYISQTEYNDWPLRVVGLQQWIQRSGSLPLSLSLYCCDSVFGEMFEPSFAREVMLVIKQNAHRCASLEMRLSQDMFNMMHTIIDIQPEVFPQLKSIRHSPSYGSTTSAEMALTLFSHWLSLPTLQEIHLAMYSAPPHLANTSSLLRWPATLTRLSFHMGSNRPILLNILRQCRMLEECALVVDSFDAADFDDLSEPSCIEKVTLPYLRRLSIDGEQDGPDSICAQLDAPALTHFLFFPPHYGIRYESENPDPDHVPRPTYSPLLTFLSGCRFLETLTLNSARIIGADFYAILESVPSVTTLILDHRLSGFLRSSFVSSARPEWCNFDYNLYPLLNQEFKSKYLNNSIPLDKPLLPNLKSFTLFCCLQHSDTHMFHDLIIAFCNSRIHAHHPTKADDDSESTSTLVGVSDNANHPPTASLEYIKITLDGLIDANTADPDLELIEVDIEADIAKHVETIGKKVGKDVHLDVAYPWIDVPQSIPTKLGPISLKEGLDQTTDYTWPYVD